MGIEVLSDCNINFNWNLVTPVVAIIVSICALWNNRHFSRKNVRLSIQQALFKTVSEKAKDCNALWDAEPESEKTPNSPHFKVVSELVISMEVIEKSFELFSVNYNSIADNKGDFYFLFWKQLSPNLRGFFADRADAIARELGNEIYSKQIRDLRPLLEPNFP
jgi:hypothetical protein